MKNIHRIAALFTLLIPGSGALAQPEAGTVQKKTDQVHRVGHEDERLLKRIDDAIAEWDPRRLASPYLDVVNTDQGQRHALRRSDLSNFITDPDAAIALGKALFWDMRAGSDFGRKTTDGGVYGTACASCHYRFGADARSRNTQAIAYQAWKKFFYGRPDVVDPGCDERVKKAPFTQRKLPFAPHGSTDVALTAFDAAAPGILQHEIVGSQGAILRLFTGINQDGTENSAPIGKASWGYSSHDMFAPNGEVCDDGSNRTRQVTTRNSPSIINAVFNDRQFHDGRAESTFNGVSIFGDYDKRRILKKALLNAEGRVVSYQPVTVGIVNASLGSQAVGPIVNEVEMSHSGRTFHDLAVRLLKAQPLSDQTVNPTDSVLKRYLKTGEPGLVDPTNPGTPITYRQMIQRAFRKEWWADDRPLTAQSSLRDRLDSARIRFVRLAEGLPESELKSKIAGILGNSTLHFPADQISAAIEAGVSNASTQSYEIESMIAASDDWSMIEAEILPLRTYVASDRGSDDPARAARLEADQTLAAMPAGGPNGLKAMDDLMVNNFSLYWGLAIMLYESTLISNDSPFDQMMRGNPAGVNGVWNGATGQRMIDAIHPVGNDVVPADPTDDDTIRKVQIDKLITKAAPPVLTGTAMFQRGFRVFMMNCSECHPPPFFTSAANMELAGGLAEPIAKRHAHSLIKTALADAFASKLAGSATTNGAGVNSATRRQLGARDFFFDQERIPVVEDAVGGLMIENMKVPTKRPVSFNTVAASPGQPEPDRVPMITWVGTRPPLEYLPSPQPGAKALDPYAFYDLGFYNIGVSEPRYDWGIWSYVGADEDITIEESAITVPEINGFVQRKDSTNLAILGITRDGVKLLKDRIIASRTNSRPSTAKDANAASVPRLGSAYRMPRARRGKSEREVQVVRALQTSSRSGQSTAPRGVDHSTERNFPELGGGEERKDRHFFKRARRLVMSEEEWGHRKPFISDNELIGWGAFKTPSLRNVALTEPYMHNGRFLTLRQVLKFYSFDNTNLIPANARLNPDLHPKIGRLLVNADGRIDGLRAVPVNISQVQDAEALLFFLHCLTDNRVRIEAAPFDHPSIRLVNGFNDDSPEKETVITVGDVGASGRPTPLPQFPANQ